MEAISIHKESVHVYGAPLVQWWKTLTLEYVLLLYPVDAPQLDSIKSSQLKHYSYILHVPVSQFGSKMEFL